MKNFETKNTEEYFDEIVLKNYTGNEFEEFDLKAENLEKIFTKREYYEAMKKVPILEKKTLYLIFVKELPLNVVAKKLRLSKTEVLNKKKNAIKHFKENLNKGGNK